MSSWKLPSSSQRCFPSLLFFPSKTQNYDARVPDQLLEFLHTYTVNVLKDAQIFQAHRQGSKVEVEDLRLAIQVGRMGCVGGERGDACIRFG